MLRSIVEYYAEHEGYKCGYCKSPNTNFSHGMWAHSLTVADYQDLIDRGWRRSGKYCYKPTMDVTCCPMYTIRCRVLEFKASKSQKKILKRFNKFLAERYMSGERKVSTSSSDDMGEQEVEHFVESTMKPQDIDINVVMNTEETIESPDKECEDNLEVLVGSSSDTNNKTDTELPKKDSGPDPNKPPCKKAKQTRRERTIEKLKLKGIDVDTMPKQNEEKQIEDFINELPADFKTKLKIRLVRTNPVSVEYLNTARETHQVYVKYQTTIHNDTPDKCTEAKFQDFLVASPLLEERPAGGPLLGYGSFHQQYWINGKLIAVGVIDILPKCVSSVYFFYDPEYMIYSMGTYGALREIHYTRQLNKTCPDIQYYYMGYYIHSCCKMRYKGNFAPSDLVCPETYEWIPIKDSVPKLEITPYARLNDDIDDIDENFPTEADINFIPCWVKGTVMPYKLYKRKMGKKGNDDEVTQYAQLVGAKALKNIILVRPKVK